MSIHLHLDKVGKRYGRHWILQDLTEDFKGGELIGIKGRNGSGKSTLLRILAGQLTPSRGKMDVELEGKAIAISDLYRLISWTGPYLELAEELTIGELLRFHFTLKPLQKGLQLADLPARMQLEQVRNRKLTDCSSGMRQRVLLATALYADTPILLLDEPTVTLDQEAIEWFHSELSTCRRARLVFIASNEADDLRVNDRIIELNSTI